MSSEIVPVEYIASRIYVFRGEKVMIDRDLAELYGVETKVLNQAVKRNEQRFPQDFKFRLTTEERNELVTNCDRLENLKHSSVMPNVFTEAGVAMLSSVVNSETAIQMNIQIIRAFIQLKQLLITESSLRFAVQALEYRLDKNEETTQMIMNTIQQMLNPPVAEKTQKMGFAPTPNEQQ